MRPLDHLYDDRTTIFNDPAINGLLAKLGEPSTSRAEAIRLIRKLYAVLANAVLSAELPKAKITTVSRTGADWQGTVIDPRTHAISLLVARAGLVPSQVVFEEISEHLNHNVCWQDVAILQRSSNAAGQVTGAKAIGAKFGNSAPEHPPILFVPDPMGATGSTLAKVLEGYREANIMLAKVVALHLVVSPEYLYRAKQLEKEHKLNINIYALRLDRGLSPPDVLATIPGSNWQREVGLNEHGYIIPGLGDMGKVLNGGNI